MSPHPGPATHLSARTLAAETATPRAWVWASVVSVAAVAVAVVWLAVPTTYPYGPDSRVTTGLNALMPLVLGATILLTLGVLGIVVVGMRARGRYVVAGSALQAAGFALVLGDASLLSSLGYAAGLMAPFLVITFLVMLVIRWPRTGALILMIVVLGVGAAWAAGSLDGAVSLVRTYLTNTIGGFVSFLAPVAWSWAMAGAAACWLWTVAHEMFRRSSGRAAWMVPPRVERWGRVATIIASLGAVPFGLLRLTWLTPWPMGGGSGELVIDQMDPATRIQGAMFILPCAGSVLLVLGLTFRWGEVFPRWLPIVAGRPVPVRVVTLIGGTVAAAVTLSAPGMFVMPFVTGDDPTTVLLQLFVFPLYLWGPALGAAVLAYWLRRTAPTAAQPVARTTT
ncbi:hypothetical protein [Pseudactinotalea sp.]|uniref:hypothetical protein n=1 Tax=Pseudactinotalea sp. TaxID=1926260 RepID=UPI003B3AE7F6